MENERILDVENMSKFFPIASGGGAFRRKTADLRAVDGISFHIMKGETLGIVGESGCGKTTTGRCVLRLYDNIKGTVSFEGTDLTKLGAEQARRARREMQMIFQDPMASLDPRMTVGKIIGEPFRAHGEPERKDEIAELFRMVELDPNMAGRYPHEFSGGQRQRIGIARALALRPKFIVCDEPVSALDVSVQAQIIALLEGLREELGLTYLFIAHDLSVVRHISDRVAVMYLGKIVEITRSDELYSNPLHPYTLALLSAVPIPNPRLDRQRRRVMLSGDVPSPVNLPRGCRFNPRCPKRASGLCSEVEPELKPLSPGSDHWVACHHA